METSEMWPILQDNESVGILFYTSSRKFSDNSFLLIIKVVQVNNDFSGINLWNNIQTKISKSGCINVFHDL